MYVCMHMKHHKALDCQVRLTQSKVLPSIQTPQIITRIITRDSDKYEELWDSSGSFLRSFTPRIDTISGLERTKSQS